MAIDTIGHLSLHPDDASARHAGQFGHLLQSVAARRRTWISCRFKISIIPSLTA